MLLNMIYQALIERHRETGVYVGSVPGIPGAHTQGASLEEVRARLVEVLQLLKDQAALEPESDFVAVTAIELA